LKLPVLKEEKALLLIRLLAVSAFPVTLPSGQERLLLKIALARLPIKVEKEPDGRKGTGEGPRFVVQTPLVAHVALEVLLGGKLHARELLEDAVDRGW